MSTKLSGMTHPERLRAMRAMETAPKQFHFEERTQQIDPRQARALNLEPVDGYVGVSDCWLEVDLGNWRAAYRLMPHRGELVIAELRLFPRDSFPMRDVGQWSATFLGMKAWDRLPPESTVANGITARLLRHVPLGADLTYATDVTEALRKRANRSLLADLGLPEQRPESRGRGGRRGRPDLFYARLAREYVGRCGVSRSPVADLAARHKLNDSIVRDMVHAARERGFLTPGRPGYRGGQLTVKAEQLLQGAKRKGTHGRKARHGQ